MWFVAQYNPTALFSLRPSNATTSGGKTLITPTPFAIKMALVDAAIRVHGRSVAKAWFPQIRDLGIAIALPVRISVINTFVKILRPHKGGAKDVFGTGLVGPMGNTIAYREMVQFGGSLHIAVWSIGDKEAKSFISNLLIQIHYLGKRGGFMQLTDIETSDELSNDFISLTDGTKQAFAIGGLMQLLDDCGPKMTFDHADIYNKKSISINKPNGRILRAIVLPYRLQQSSRGFSLYERM